MDAQTAVSRNDALVEYYPMVTRIAHRAAATYGLPVGLEATDLVSSGVIGLAEAWERYDSSRGVAFEAYAVPRIRGAVIDAIRASDWIPRKARQRSRNTGEPLAVLVSLDGGRDDSDIGKQAERRCLELHHQRGGSVGREIAESAGDDASRLRASAARACGRDELDPGRQPVGDYRVGRRFPTGVVEVDRANEVLPQTRRRP